MILLELGLPWKELKIGQISMKMPWQVHWMLKKVNKQTNLEVKQHTVKKVIKQKLISQELRRNFALSRGIIYVQIFRRLLVKRREVARSNNNQISDLLRVHHPQLPKSRLMAQRGSLKLWIVSDLKPSWQVEDGTTTPWQICSMLPKLPRHWTLSHSSAIQPVNFSMLLASRSLPGLRDGRSLQLGLILLSRHNTTTWQRNQETVGRWEEYDLSQDPGKRLSRHSPRKNKGQGKQPKALLVRGSLRRTGPAC